MTLGKGCVSVDPEILTGDIGALLLGNPREDPIQGTESEIWLDLW